MKQLQLRPYQQAAVHHLSGILKTFGVAYLVGELRTGKTIVALSAAKEYGNILFVTKKKAKTSIREDVVKLGIEDKVQVVNYESSEKKLAKLDTVDVVIYDEAHSMGKYPKPGKRVKLLKEYFEGIPSILMSGTPSPESHSQLFHQFWVTGLGPWKKYKTFFQWSYIYVNVEKIFIGMGRLINNYSKAKKQVLIDFNPYKVIMTQENAGFKGKIIEMTHLIDMPPKIQLMLSLLKKDRILTTGANVVADTGAKLMSAFHQLSSGTIIQSDGVSKTVSDYKIQFISEHWPEHKKAIFYVYKQEGEMLKKAYKNLWTTDYKEFNESKDKVFISQVVSGREGIDLRTAEVLIFFNISYSAVSYWQARARSQSKDGGNKEVHWLFSNIPASKKTIEQKIFEVVQSKKSFTTKHFKTYA
jgi:hypothetical protein